ASRNELATDAPFDGFHAGAFTYLLTRYLWQENRDNSLDTVFVNLTRRTKDIAKSSGLLQEPEFEVKPGSDYATKPIYFLDKIRPAAEAVIRNVNGNQVEFWLGGVASQSLAAFKTGAVFTIIDDEGRELGQIEQEERNGLVGRGKVLATAQPGVVKEGMLLRERVRGIPTDLALRVGVDETLGAEKAQALTALQGQKRIELVSGANADYLFGRVTQEDIQSWQRQQIPAPPAVGSLGVFTTGRVPIPDSFGQVGESVPDAVKRLRPKLKLLLAGRILQTLVNGDSSQLDVATSIKPVSGRGTSGTIASRGTRNAQSALPPSVISSQKVQFKAGTEIQLQVQNNESRNIYASALFISGSGEIVILFPLDWDAPEDRALVAPGQTISIPQADDNFQFQLGDDAGTLEVLVLASLQPLRLALRGLQSIARGRGIGRGMPAVLNEDEPVDVMGNLLGDLDTQTRSGRAGRAPEIKIVPKVQAVDTTKLAAMSIAIEIVK
ncbi:MAG TPA: DUF4384 domain-containing protein, partial [Coleofasciculaceae cyanobacterium]